MSNDSSTGGYLQPSSTAPLPGPLTFVQFIQTALVGVSGFDGTLVRPKWQQKPPPKPGPDINWCAFQVSGRTQDTFAYSTLDDANNYQFQRNSEHEIQISMYGPLALENTDQLCDGFQLTQNLEALLSAKISFVESTQAIHAPELVNEVWYDRYEFAIKVRRLVQRTYAILPFASASGSINTIINSQDNVLDWLVDE